MSRFACFARSKEDFVSSVEHRLPFGEFDQVKTIKMKPSEKFARIYGCVQKVAMFIGFDLYNERSQRTRRRDVVYTFAFSIAFLAYYTLFDLYQERDKASMLRLLFLLSPGTAAIIRSVLLIINSKHQYRSMTETLNLYKANETSTPERLEIIRQRVRPLELSILLIAVSYSVLWLSFPIFSLVRHFEIGHKDLLLPIELPFIGAATEVGYLINFVVQLIVICIGICGVVAFDSITLLFGMQVVMIADLFECTLREVSLEINELKETDADYGKKMKKLIQRIVDEHRAHNDYVATFMEYTKPQSLVVLVFNFIGIVASLIAILTSTFYMSVGGLVLSLNQIFVSCIVGTLISTQVIRFLIHNLLSYTKRKFLIRTRS